MAEISGYNGKILRVDLTRNSLGDEYLDEATLRKYLGGVNLGVKILCEEVPPGVEWNSPANRVIIASGPLGGTSVHGSGTISVVTKGAMTQGATSTQANGFLGAFLRLNGYDAIVVQGASQKLVYLYIHDGQAELKDAASLKGKDTWETEDLIKKELGYVERQHQMSVFGIGPAGENLSRFAAFVGDRGHVAAHNGVGAVFGSKKLKAVAIARGNKTIKLADRAELTKANNEFLELIKGDPRWSRVYNDGMFWGIQENAPANTLPVRNYTTNIFNIEPESLKKWNVSYVRQKYQAKPHSCWACQMHHCHILHITEGPYTGYIGEEPEAEALSAWGPLIGNTDVASMIMLSNEVDRNGFDTNEAGWVIAFVMECYQRGILTKKDLGGLEMTWGNVDATRELLQRIAFREGIGDILAEGVMRAAAKLGGEAVNMAIHPGKGGTPRSHDHRLVWAEMFDTCVSNTGTIEADAVARPAQLGIPGITDPFSPLDVSSFIARSKGSFQVLDSLGTCKFCVRTVPSLIVRLLKGSTGWDLTWEELMFMGRRTVNMMRVFNVTHGIGPEVEKPSPRYGSIPVDGPGKGKEVLKSWDIMLDNYYQIMGWDRKTGKPMPETLRGLGLDEYISRVWPGKV